MAYAKHDVRYLWVFHFVCHNVNFFDEGKGMGINIGNSIFPGLNDKHGLMICGYEWGFSKPDQEILESGRSVFFNENAVATFSNKSPVHGERALVWKYDNRIIKWFGLWGHPLSRDGLGGDFEKLVVQTNWCNTEGNTINESYFKKLTASEQVNNFIFHIKEFQPSLILFMGSDIINILQDPSIKYKFEEIMGKSEAPPEKIQKQFSGRRFKVGFQKFKNCQVVSLPHPSSSRGLADDYIALFETEIGWLIDDLKARHAIKNRQIQA